MVIMDIYHELNDDLKRLVCKKLEEDNKNNRCYTVSFNGLAGRLDVYVWDIWCDPDPRDELFEIECLRRCFDIETVVIHCECEYTTAGPMYPVQDHIFEKVVHEYLGLRGDQIVMVYDFSGWD
jgi:hypothetical protein